MQIFYNAVIQTLTTEHYMWTTHSCHRSQKKILIKTFRDSTNNNNNNNNNNTVTQYNNGDTLCFRGYVWLLTTKMNPVTLLRNNVDCCEGFL
jgi:hypothetical protein